MEQQEMFAKDKLDPEAAKLADKVIGLIAKKRVVADRLDINTKLLLTKLKSMGKNKVKHKGYLIEVKHTEEADSLKVKDVKDKEIKPRKARRRK